MVGMLAWLRLGLNCSSPVLSPRDSVLSVHLYECSWFLPGLHVRSWNPETCRDMLFPSMLSPLVAISSHDARARATVAVTSKGPSHLGCCLPRLSTGHSPLPPLLVAAKLRWPQISTFLSCPATARDLLLFFAPSEDLKADISPLMAPTTGMHTTGSAMLHDTVRVTFQGHEVATWRWDA